MKVVSYNLNRLATEGAGGADKRRALTDFVSSESADLYFFQLVSREVLAHIRTALDGYHACVFAAHDSEDAFGLAILSKVDVVPESRCEHRFGESEKLFALSCSVSLSPGEEVRVTNVHLHNTSESIRLDQVASLVESDSINATRMIVGDFNALTKSDYFPHEWSALVDLAREREWEERQERATTSLTASTAGTSFVDTCRWIDEERRRGSEKECASSAVAERLHTYVLTLKERAVRLRLDYVFLRPCPSKLRPIDFHVCHDVHLSNHFPVVCTLSRSTKHLQWCARDVASAPKQLRQ
ncbi:hypothetical protein HOP50_03g26630 [Chloropicon primus]|uniref:Endonuclease/exonuclease/phosphatase domain-containing protein n=1 Tax=Chloropicon primus TaxID=1764295 RepID=A0A5B8MJ78_9CHLO|nr:hypothetical protein A3770_03p26620 [Chloropicon primus]UPQ99356.1 hypothetical protein HOP50_03g26630 [Chloropicon primus]|eukprot:QDZ20144.1 hypothetical protein A3770_03p26620 [Chloropicon primus]